MIDRYNIIVVGAGTAGMMAAIFAAQRGLKVAVLEKSDHIGGAMHWSGGHMSAGGTKLQKRKGIVDSPSAHYEDIMRINNHSGDLDLIKKAVEAAPETIDWLDDLGFEFSSECPRIVYGHVPYLTARTHYGVENARTILKTITPLWNNGIKQENITLLLNNKVIELVKNNNRYDTVLCQTQKGELSYKADHIIITTGGYGSNPEFFHQKHPEIPLISAAYPAATADGHQLLEQKGAEFRMANMHLSSLGGIEVPAGSGRCDFYEGWANVLTSVYRMPRDIYIDQNGNRFIAEDEKNPDTRERTILKKGIWNFWIVFDESALLERDENGHENNIILNWNTDRIKAQVTKGSIIYSASTIEELAKKINVPQDNLNATVSHFNQMVDDGKDPDFGRTYLKNKIKDAPFYAFKVHASVLVTFGGIKVNSNFEVLNKNNEILDGLYAAGEILGLGATSGNAFCSGMAITPCLSFGRLLGQTLAK